MRRWHNFSGRGRGLIGGLAHGFPTPAIGRRDLRVVTHAGGGSRREMARPVEGRRLLEAGLAVRNRHLSRGPRVGFRSRRALRYQL